MGRYRTFQRISVVPTPVNFVFPTVGSNEASTREASARNVDVYVASVRDQLRNTLWEV